MSKLVNHKELEQELDRLYNKICCVKAELEQCSVVEGCFSSKYTGPGTKLLTYNGTSFVFVDDVAVSAFPTVDTYADLPSPVGLGAPDNVYLVLNTTGTWFINRRERGLYYSDGATWSRLGDVQSIFIDDTFQIKDNVDPNKVLQFNVDLLTGPALKYFKAGTGTIAEITDIPTDYLSINQSTLFVNTDILSNYLGTAYTSHLHSQYLTTQLNQAISGSNSSLTFQTISFGNLNGLSHYISNGSLVGSYTVPTDYISTGQSSIFQQSSLMSNYQLTSDNSLFEYKSHTSVFLTTQTSLVFSNSNGISFGTNGSTITAIYTIPTDYISTNQSTLFQYSSLMSNYLDITYTTHTHSQYLTTAMLSDAGSRFVNVTAGLNLTNISATLASNSISLSVAAPVTTNGLISNINISAGTTSGNLSKLTFSDSNGITFGLNNSVITATVKTDYQSSNANYLTSQSNQAFSVGGGSTTFQTLSFGNSNGFTFSNSNGSIIGSYTVPTQSVQPVAVSGTNGSFNYSTLSLGNSNGLLFYTTNGSIVGSYTVPSTVGFLTTAAQSNQVVNSINGSTGQISLNIGSSLSSSVNGSSITFGLASNITTALQSAGAYLTTADLSQNSSNYFRNWKLTGNTAGTSSSAQGTDFWLGGGNGVTISGSSNTISFSVATNYQSQGAYLTTAMLSNAATISNINISAGTTSGNLSNLVFSNSNGVSFGLNGSTLTASVNAGVQPAIQSIQVSDTTYTTGAVIFSNANGLSFGSSAGGAITASYTVPNIANLISNINLSAGTTSNNLSAFTFNNSNGVSFGLNGSVLTATVQTNYLTTARASSDAIGLNTALTGNGVLWTVNSSGLSLNIPAFVTTAALSSQTLVFSIGGNSGTTNSSQISNGGFVLAGGNNITLLQSNNSISISGMSQSIQPVAISGSNGSFVYSTLSMGSSNGLHFYSTNGSLVGSYTVPIQSVQTQNLVSIQGSTGNIQFVNSNGITFGFNGSTITASHNGITSESNQQLSVYATNNTTQNSSGLINASNLIFNGLGIASVGVSNGSVLISVPSGGGGADGYNIIGVNGAGTQLSTTLQLSDANNISFGLNAGTITASASFNQSPIAISGSNGSFAYSTLSLGNSNSINFYTTNGSVVASYDVLPFNIAQTEVNFGAITQREYNAKITVNDANITANSLIIVSVSATTTSDHSIDEVLIEEITVIAGNVVAGVSFDIMVYCASGTWGKYKINYTIKY